MESNYGSLLFIFHNDKTMTVISKDRDGKSHVSYENQPEKFLHSCGWIKLKFNNNNTVNVTEFRDGKIYSRTEKSIDGSSELIYFFERPREITRDLSIPRATCAFDCNEFCAIRRENYDSTKRFSLQKCIRNCERCKNSKDRKVFAGCYCGGACPDCVMCKTFIGRPAFNDVFNALEGICGQCPQGQFFNQQTQQCECIGGTRPNFVNVQTQPTRVATIKLADVIVARSNVLGELFYSIDLMNQEIIKFEYSDFEYVFADKPCTKTTISQKTIGRIVLTQSDKPDAIKNIEYISDEFGAIGDVLALVNFVPNQDQNSEELGTIQFVPQQQGSINNMNSVSFAANPNEPKGSVIFRPTPDIEFVPSIEGYSINNRVLGRFRLKQQTQPNVTLFTQVPLGTPGAVQFIPQLPPNVPQNVAFILADPNIKPGAPGTLLFTPVVNGPIQYFANNKLNGPGTVQYTPFPLPKTFAEVPQNTPGAVQFLGKLPQNLAPCTFFIADSSKRPSDPGTALFTPVPAGTPNAIQYFPDELGNVSGPGNLQYTPLPKPIIFAETQQANPAAVQFFGTLPQNMPQGLFFAPDTTKKVGDAGTLFFLPIQAGLPALPGTENATGPAQYYSQQQGLSAPGKILYFPKAKQGVFVETNQNDPSAVQFVGKLPQNLDAGTFFKPADPNIQFGTPGTLLFTPLPDGSQGGVKYYSPTQDALSGPGNVQYIPSPKKPADRPESLYFIKAKQNDPIFIFTQPIAGAPQNAQFTLTQNKPTTDYIEFTFNPNGNVQYVDISAGGKMSKTGNAKYISQII